VFESYEQIVKDELKKIRRDTALTLGRAW